MSLHMFLENGEIQGYASEHYDKWVENAKEVKQVDVCEFMHKFVKPLIKKANKYDSLVEKIKEVNKQADKKIKENNKIISMEWLDSHMSMDDYFARKHKLMRENEILEMKKQHTRELLKGE